MNFIFSYYTLIFLIVLNCLNVSHAANSCSDFLSYDNRKSLFHRVFSVFNRNVDFRQLDPLLASQEKPGLEEVTVKILNGDYFTDSLSGLKVFDLKTLNAAFRRNRSKFQEPVSNIIRFKRRTISYGHIGGRNFFVKKFEYHDVRGHIEDLRREINFTKLMSDLDWGPHLYGVITDKGKVVGYIAEFVSGEWSSGNTQQIPPNSHRHSVLREGIARQEILAKTGIDTEDFQLLLGQNRSWVIDTGLWSFEKNQKQLEYTELLGLLETVSQEGRRTKP